jgi:hypothetical protein
MYSRVVAEVNVSPLSADERRQRARQAILEAFAERPMKLIQGEVVESKVIAGRDIAAANEQANSEASDEREG